MEKKNLYALVAFVALAVSAVYSLRSPDKGERVGERPRAIAEIKAGSIATVEVAQPGDKDKVTLTKKGDKWQVTAPYDKPADQTAAKSAAEALEKVRWGDLVTQQKTRHAEFEVTDDKAVHVVAKDSGGAVLADVFIGKASGSATMVRVAGKDDVWQAIDLYSSTYKRESKTWREHSIYDLKADDSEKITIQGAGTKVTLVREPVPAGADGKPGSQNIYEAKWKITEGDATLTPSLAVENSLLNRMVQSVSTLRASDFHDAAKPEEVGLAAGAAGQIVVSVGYKEGKSAGVRIGAVKGEDTFVQTVDSAQIFTVKKYAIESIAHIPQDVREKSLLSMKADQIDAVTIQQGTDVVSLKLVDKTWKADKLPDADEAKIKQIVEGFDGLAGTGFVAPDAPELKSLVPGKATITVKPKTGAPIVLKVGDARGEDLAVQKAGSDAMWVRKMQLDRLLKKPADLAKDKNPPPAAPPPGPGGMPFPGGLPN